VGSSWPESGLQDSTLYRDAVTQAGPKSGCMIPSSAVLGYRLRRGIGRVASVLFVSSQVSFGSVCGSLCVRLLDLPPRFGGLREKKYITAFCLPGKGS
jgi:hypothetical protein